MSGWEKVIAATLLAVIGLVGLNLAIWRRLRAGAQSERLHVKAQDEAQGGV